MSIENIINLTAAVGVIISVVFLAIQTRKNTKFVKANFYDSLASSNSEFLRQLVEDKELGKLFENAVNSWNDLSVDDKRTSNYLFIQLFRMWENTYYQNKMGILESWLWKSYKNTIISYFHHNGVQEWWINRKQTFSDEFRNFLEDSEKPKLPIKTIEDLKIVVKDE
jgi:hypothetical protein